MRLLAASLARVRGRLAFAAALGAATVALTVGLVAPAALATPESDAVDAINQAWAPAGGADSPVGGADGDIVQVGAGYAQKFTGGKIFFSPASGAHLLYGPVLDKYESLGGPADSDLGFPTIDVVPGLIGPDSAVSTFDASDKPAIFWTPDSGAWVVRGPINAAWDKLGGSAGTLGVPTEDERYDGDVVAQRFTGGELSWNAANRTFTTDPPDLAEGLAGLEVPSDATTLINQAWRASGGLGGPLGARQGEQIAIGDNGAAQGYAGGKIFYSPQTGAHAVTGAILSKYETLGGPAGDLGYPVGVETDGGVPNSRVDAFSAPDKPVIFWTPDTGAIVVRGPINAAWAKLGGATGTLGVPTGEQTADGDTLTQNFSGGQITWDRAARQFRTTPPELASSLAGLELPDGLAQAPSTTGPEVKSDKGFRWNWWWLLLALPLLLLLVLLAVRSRRKEPQPPRSAADRDYQWAAPATAEEAAFAADEDAIDTAPTRIPTEAELAELPGPGDHADLDSGRHSAITAPGTPKLWELDLEDTERPRRRHAVAEPESELGFEVEFIVEPDDEDEPPLQLYELDELDAGPVPGPAGPGVDEGWRPAIHLPLADPYRAPAGYSIKGNTHSGLFYTPDSALYDNTLPDVWFASEEAAESNGFVKAPE